MYAVHADGGTILLFEAEMAKSIKARTSAFTARASSKGSDEEALEPLSGLSNRIKEDKRMKFMKRDIELQYLCRRRLTVTKAGVHLLILYTFVTDLYYPTLHFIPPPPSQHSKHIPKPRPIILHRHPIIIIIVPPPPLQFPFNKRRRRPLLPAAVFPLQLPVLKHQERPQREGQDGGEEHEGGADGHAFSVAGGAARREDVRAEEGAALADEVDEDEGAAAAGVGALVVCVGGGGRLVFSFRMLKDS